MGVNEPEFGTERSFSQIKRSSKTNERCNFDTRSLSLTNKVIITMLLSPLATPFQPASSSMTGVICNDGCPSLVSSDHDILQGIPDETIDEFPQTAQDAAELEAVEMFVDILATLSILEEREDRARSSFCHVTKRWEVRREDGLVGKPRLAKNLVQLIDHAHTGKPVTTTDVVPATQRMNAADILESRQRAREEARRQNSRADKKMGRMNQPRPLQQPRKQN